MASLLALLSHPSEITGVDEGMTSQAVIFVIDEFDMFTYHPRQTLLYNLFDIAQARKAPIAVLGCTGKVDVVEMLEKRVKSRFSHRYVFVPPARSLPAYWDICKQGLAVDGEVAEIEGLETGLEGFDEFLGYWSKKIDVGSRPDLAIQHGMIWPLRHLANKLNSASTNKTLSSSSSKPISTQQNRLPPS